jgi:ABC-2 type transport system permease protein
MTASGWWSGTRLVAGRAMAESARSRTWRTITALTLVAGLAVAIVPRLISHDGTTYRLATVGAAPAVIAATLEAAGSAGGFGVQLQEMPDESAAIAAVRAGDVDAALTGVGATATLYVLASGSGAFPALVSQAAQAQATSAAMREAGLDPRQIARIQAITGPRQVPVSPVADAGRAAVGVVIGIVLYLSLLIAGATIAGAVATEKTSRICEVLLAVLRPTQLLVGTVAGVGVMMVVQIAAILVPSFIGIVTRGTTVIPVLAGADVGLAMAWFLLGLVLYAFVFAALGALVDKPSEVGSATLPANLMLVASYLVGVMLAATNPNSWGATIASIFPFSAPLVMPIRWASGLVPVWQLVVAMAVTAVTALATALLASRMYARGVTRTGRRLGLREALAS